MSLNYTRVTEVGNQVKSVAEDAKSLYLRLVEVLETNSDLTIDWGAGSTPTYINEQADGNLDSFNFTRQQVANAIGTLDSIRNLFEGNAPSQGDHLGNMNLIADAEVKK